MSKYRTGALWLALSLSPIALSSANGMPLFSASRGITPGASQLLPVQSGSAEAEKMEAERRKIAEELAKAKAEADAVAAALRARAEAEKRAIEQMPANIIVQPKTRVRAIPSPYYSWDRAMMAKEFVSAGLLRPQANTGSIGEDRKRPDGTKTKPGRAQTVNNTG